MRNLCVFVSVVALAVTTSASWYWPFGSDEDEPDQPRLSELMEPATELIDEASDLASEGKVAESVEKYRKALTELDRIEAENPERAQGQEFATVRNKRAYINAAIDAMLMSQVKRNAKAVAVSDTTELEKKLAEEKAAKAGKKPKTDKKENAEAGKDEKAKKEAAADKPKEDKTAEKKEAAAKKEEKPAQEVKPAEPKPAEVKPVAANPAPAAAPANEPRPSEGKMRIIYDIAHRNYEAAEIAIAKMLAQKPNDPSALNLKAALRSAQGRLKDAEAALDQAIMSNPRSHHAYYNMALLMLRINPQENRPVAKRYYDTGRSVGGPEDPELEGLLK